jgi:hypothetical protein
VGNNSALPFERGTSQSAPGLEGGLFFDEAYKQWVMICRNTDAAAVAYRRIVKWEDASAYQVDYATAPNNGPMVAGVVDNVLGSSNTVPVNKNYYVILGGIVTVATGSGMTAIVAGGLVVVDDDAAKGKVGGTTVSATGGDSVSIGQLRNAIGVAQGAAASGAVGAVEMLLWKRHY